MIMDWLVEILSWHMPWWIAVSIWSVVAMLPWLFMPKPKQKPPKPDEGDPVVSRKQAEAEAAARAERQGRPSSRRRL